MLKDKKKEFCERCQKHTLHTFEEDALEISSYCHECKLKKTVVKTFF